jgi:uncharacterized protein (DUF1330 family)
MSACVIGHITVHDGSLWDHYRAQVPATLAPWGAEILFRGRLDKVLGGSHDHRDTVVIRFPDTEAIDAWFASPAYQALIPLRERAADVVLLSYWE